MHKKYIIIQKVIRDRFGFEKWSQYIALEIRILPFFVIQILKKRGYKKVKLI